MGRLRARIRGLEQETSADVIAVRHLDGSASHFYQDSVMECFLHESGRGRRAHFGEEPGEAHPLTVALRTATNLEALMAEQGTMMGFFVGEDEIIRGLRGRGGRLAVCPDTRPEGRTACHRRRAAEAGGRRVTDEGEG